jgi:branched-chain amino acid transport system ATP-binding protein
MSAAVEPGTVDAPRSTSVLELRGITGGYGRTMVLRDIDLVVRHGAIDTVIGPNGAGKSTLLKTAGGLLRPSAGTVLIEDRDVTGQSPAKRAAAGLCLIPEGRGIWRNLSVRENLLLQVPPGDKATQVDRALETFPILRDRLRQRAGTLSGGQQQMLAVARCYLSSPSLILLDEVSIGLAPRIVDQIFESLLRLAAEGIAMVLVEQYVNRALEMAQTAHILDRGRIVFTGEASSLDEETVMRGYLGGRLDGSPATNGSV